MTSVRAGGYQTTPTESRVVAHLRSLSVKNAINSIFLVLIHAVHEILLLYVIHIIWAIIELGAGELTVQTLWTKQQQKTTMINTHINLS